MLIIAATGSTNVVVTLSDLTINKVNPYFTWDINRKGSNDNIIFYTDDLSTSPYYNEFNITVATSSIGLTSGIINLIEGEWIYNIYEMQNKYDLNISNSVKLLENGLMVVGLTQSLEPQITEIPVITVSKLR